MDRGLDVLFAKEIMGWSPERTEEKSWYEPISGLWKEPDSITKLISTADDPQLVLELIYEKLPVKRVLIERDGDDEYMVYLETDKHEGFGKSIWLGEALAEAAIRLKEVVA